ncbi:MAG: M15 family metallopeptidase [Microbacteriaceae bacterium]|nr:M15 family metallopeptidase [Microbacteriaceae bacterium]
MTETNDEPERDEALGADAEAGPGAGAPADAETRAGAETVGADAGTEAAVEANDSAEADAVADSAGPGEHDAVADPADPAGPADPADPDAAADPSDPDAPAERDDPADPSDPGAAADPSDPDASAERDETAERAALAAAATRRRRGRAAVVVGTVAVLATVAAGAALIATGATGAAGRGEPLTVASPTASASSAPTPAPTPSPTPTATPTTDPTATAAEPPAPTPTPTPEADGLDLTTASSLTVLVNKRTPLDPQGYEPSDLVAMSDLGVPSMNDHSLRRPAAEAIAEMFADAEAAGLHLDMTSGYRDFELQQHLYDEHVEQLGAAGADEVSARPGRSEHQTGLAADISAPGSDPGCIIETCFADTEAGQWLAEHAWEYGFILRYPEGLQSITGFTYEPWHFRFVGVEVAADYHASGAATYEEFVGAPDAPDYG